MNYSEPEIAVLKKYRILDRNGAPTMVNLIRPLTAGGPPPGHGPMVAPDVIKKLLAADTTPDKRWLDWIFFQAGGGQAAKDNVPVVMREIRDRFIDERINGFTHPRTNQFLPPVSREEAEKRWQAQLPHFEDLMVSCDQDTVKHLRVFGFFRDWPGDGESYKKVVEALTKYLSLYDKLRQMNAEVAREGGEPLPEKPEEIGTFTQMMEIATKTERYFASKKARGDIREETIYDDDMITAVAPLTYAAAVRYGYDLWPWASRANFERVLTSDGTAWNNRDEWKNLFNKGGAMVYLKFKVPVPAWMARRDGNFELKDLTDLAMHLSTSDADGNPDEWKVYDQENRNSLTIGVVKSMILAEPTRVDPADQESPLSRGRNVYKTAQEAEDVVQALQRAVQAVQRWLGAFDTKKIKRDALTLD